MWTWSAVHLSRRYPKSTAYRGVGHVHTSLLDGGLGYFSRSLALSSYFPLLEALDE